MIEAEARDRARALLPSLGLDPSFTVAAAEKRIIEIVAGAPPEGLPGPGPRVDRIAWVVSLASAPFTVEMALDDATGELLRLRRPRGLGLPASPGGAR
ncbi:MAG: hypothetical protein U0359_06570 [Byssovorax sp.]